MGLKKRKYERKLKFGEYKLRAIRGGSVVVFSFVHEALMPINGKGSGFAKRKLSFINERE